MTENKVQLDVFEGPLDLLLYLVKKEEVDIYQVNLTKIATQFIAYIDLLRQLDLEVAGEFLVMASTLMYIKSRELLPDDLKTSVAQDDDDDETDPRWELIRQLVEYKKFKDAAGRLQERESLQEHIFTRTPAKLEFTAPAGRPEVTLFDLVNAVSTILKRHFAKDESRDVFQDPWTVSEKIESLGLLIRSRPRLRFSELFEQTTSRIEVVVTFLALLELIRLKQLIVTQEEPFSEIEIRSQELTPDPTASAPAPAGASAVNPDPASAPAPVEGASPRPEATQAAPETEPLA